MRVQGLRKVLTALPLPPHLPLTSSTRHPSHGKAATWALTLDIQPDLQNQPTSMNLRKASAPLEDSGVNKLNSCLLWAVNWMWEDTTGSHKKIMQTTRQDTVSAIQNRQWVQRKILPWGPEEWGSSHFYSVASALQTIVFNPYTTLQGTDRIHITFNYIYVSDEAIFQMNKSGLTNLSNVSMSQDPQTCKCQN